jgi:hypothetical protein
MSYQNPDYETKLAEAKARKIIASLKRSNAGKNRKEKEASAGLVAKRKTDIDKKVLEIDAQKFQELEKKLKTKAKVHPKPEPPPPPPPKSLVIENTQEAIQAPPPFKQVPGGRGRGRGRGGSGAPARQLTFEEIEANRRKIRDYDQQVFGKLSNVNPGLPLGFYGRDERRIMAEKQKEAKARAKRASGKSEFSDSDFSD